LIENEQFDLYVVDANLPDVSGLQLCREIRVRDRTTPIVMFSAAAYDKDQEEGLRAGASKYVVKPAIERVLSTIHQLLRERAMRR
jgi:DNA-binding response OmpR family regulator